MIQLQYTPTLKCPLKINWYHNFILHTTWGGSRRFIQPSYHFEIHQLYAKYATLLINGAQRVYGSIEVTLGIVIISRRVWSANYWIVGICVVTGSALHFTFGKRKSTSSTAVQSQKVVSAHFSSEQILPFGFTLSGINAGLRTWAPLSDSVEGDVHTNWNN